MKNAIRFLAASAAVLFAFGSQATVRHVDYVNGADSGDGTGTGASAWKTLAYAVENADANDEIILAKGTHMLPKNTHVEIDKALDIHGTGENWETILDANHQPTAATNPNSVPHIRITADGAKLSNVTLYRLSAAGYHVQHFVMTGDSIVSNCVITASGTTENSNQKIVDISKGLMTCCWITNNASMYTPMIQLGGTAHLENSVIARNVCNSDQGNGLVSLPCGNVVMRNCTVVENVTTGTKCAVGVYYASGSLPKIYNCVFWGNTNKVGDVRNYYFRKWYSNNVIHNCIGNPIRGDSSEMSINDVDPGNKGRSAGKENISDNPMLEYDTFFLTSQSCAELKSGAKTGADAQSVAYCTDSDIFGNPRGLTPSMGAFQYIPKGGMEVTVRADKTEARLPATIGLYCEVDGATGALSYSWDFDNDGVEDSTEATPSLATVGTYSSVKVTVSDGVNTKTATYDGTLTILPKFLDVTVSADKTAVRTPGVITLNVEIADDVTEPLTYSWDLDGDGIEDSTAANPQLTAEGYYVNPKLLCVSDADGKYSDEVTLTGTFSILPANASVYYVDPVDGDDGNAGTEESSWKSLSKALAEAFDGDEIVLAKGTHQFEDNFVIDRPIKLRGAGENWETVLDANHTVASTKAPHMKITADGAEISNLTFYRLCGGGSHNGGLFTVTGDSIISNCVFTGSGIDSGDNKLLVTMSKGLLESCWITNNLCRNNPMISLSDSAKMENCIVAKNVSRMATTSGLIAASTGPGGTIIRNCTIVENALAGVGCALKTQYGKEGVVPKVYNNIIWGNTNEVGAVRNYSFRKWWATNTIHNDIIGPVLDENNAEYGVNYKESNHTTGSENIEENPHLDETYGLTAAAVDTLKSGAKKGLDAQNAPYCAVYDIFGNPRGEGPSMGAIQYVASSTLSATIQAPATTARLPETITLTVAVEGTDSENITYAWDINGDGNADSFDSTVTLNEVGTYDNISVTVSDGNGNVTATYDGVLTILAELLDVTIIANGEVVRQPGALTFSASIANDYAEPLTYSWDTDGDNVVDYSGAVVSYSALGVYSAPKLISIVDANGKRNDNITLEGSFAVHPAEDQVYYVDYANGSDDDDGSAAHPFKTLKHVVELPNLDADDEIILKRGTHTVAAAVNVKRGVHIHGEGEKEETILDANNGNPVNFTVSAAGALLNNLTFYRFGHTSNNGYIRFYGDSVYSNIVVTGCGVDANIGTVVDMSAGRFCNSWVTNNLAGYNAGMSIAGNSIMENCALLNNRSTSPSQSGGAVLTFGHGVGHRLVRNCTIANNTFGNKNVAVYGYCWEGAKESVRLYNNIVYNNRQANDSVSNCVNWASQKWFVKNNCWDYNDASKLQDPNKGTAYGSVFADPRFDATKGAPRLTMESPCRNAGWEAAYEEGELDTAVDVFGNKRRYGRRIDIGCIEFNGAGTLLLVR